MLIHSCEHRAIKHTYTHLIDNQTDGNLTFLIETDIFYASYF